MKKCIVILLLAVGLPGFHTCIAEEARFPEHSGFVNDYTGILTDSARLRLQNLLEEVEKKTSAEVAVVIIKTTRPFTIEQYAVELFQKWGIGKKERDNGVLLLVAVEDRTVRIETGYGLEGAVTDLESKRIIQNFIVPWFKKGDYETGIFAGTLAIIEIIGKEYSVKLDIDKDFGNISGYNKSKTSSAEALFVLFFFILVFGLRFGTFFFLMGSGSGRYWSSGSGGAFGGGFGGFGGGMSGSGGASGSW